MDSEEAHYQKQVMARILLEWLKSVWGEGLIALSDIYQYAPAPFRSKAVAADMARILEEFGWLRREGKGLTKGKRHRLVWRIDERQVPR